MAFFKIIDHFLGKLYSFIGNAIGLSIGFFAIAISADLVLRLFNFGNLPGIQEIIEYLLFAGVFLGAPWVLRLGAHIRVDVFISALNERAARCVGHLLDFIGFVISATLVVFGTFNLRDAVVFQSMQMKYYNVPEWCLLGVFVLSFFLLSLEFLSRIFRGGPATDASEPNAGGV